MAENVWTRSSGENATVKGLGTMVSTVRRVRGTWLWNLCPSLLSSFKLNKMLEFKSKITAWKHYFVAFIWMITHTAIILINRLESIIALQGLKSGVNEFSWMVEINKLITALLLWFAYELIEKKYFLFHTKEAIYLKFRNPILRCWFQENSSKCRSLTPMGLILEALQF